MFFPSLFFPSAWDIAAMFCTPVSWAMEIVESNDATFDNLEPGVHHMLFDLKSCPQPLAHSMHTYQRRPSVL